MKNQIDEKPKVYASQPQSKKGLILGVAAVVVVTICAYFLWNHANVPSVPVGIPHQELKSVPKIAEQSAPSNVDAVPDKLTTVKIPEPVPPEAKFNIKLESVVISQIESVPGQSRLEFACKITDKKNDPELLAIINRGSVAKIEVDGALPVKPIPNHGGLDKAIQDNHSAMFNFGINVPDTAKTVSLVDGAVSAIYAVRRNTVEWNDLVDIRKKTKTFESFEFTVADFQVANGAVSFELQYKAPPGAPDEPSYWAVRFVKPAVRCTDGSVLFAKGGGGGLGGGNFHISDTIQTNGKTPKSFEVAFVSEVRPEEIQFSFQNVKVPIITVPARAPGVAVGPRGMRTIMSEGYQFHLQSVEIKQDSHPSTEMRIVVVPRQDKVPIYAPWNVTGGLATDDVGNTVHAIDDFQTERQVLPKGTPVFVHFPFPSEKADRFVTVSGKYRVYVADEIKSSEVLLPAPGKELSQPIDAPPITLTSLVSANNFVSMKTTLNNDVQANVESNFYCTFRELFTNNGTPLKHVGSGSKRCSKWVEFADRYAIEGDLPGKVVLRYVAKGHFEEIRFEFKDVGLPRTIGTINEKKEKF